MNQAAPDVKKIVDKSKIIQVSSAEPAGYGEMYKTNALSAL